MRKITEKDKKIAFYRDEQRTLQARFQRAELKLTRIAAGKKAAETRRKNRERNQGRP
jgi:hypothetical protein